MERMIFLIRRMSIPRKVSGRWLCLTAGVSESSFSPVFAELDPSDAMLRILCRSREISGSFYGPRSLEGVEERFRPSLVQYRLFIEACFSLNSRIKNPFRTGENSEIAVLPAICNEGIHVRSANLNRYLQHTGGSQEAQRIP